MDIDLLLDICYSKEYVSLYQNTNSELFEFRHQSGNDIFYNISIKRPITHVGNCLLEETYYDLESAYGYGGFYTNSVDQKFIEESMSLYKKRCIEENIVAEFQRYHPFNTFAKENNSFFHFLKNDRNIAVIDLSLSKEDRWASYSSNTRNILRKCEKNLSVKLADSFEPFLELYEETMSRHSAADFYYFTKEYYERLFRNDNNILLDIFHNSTLVSSGFFLFGNDLAYYHLSGNSFNDRKLNGNYLLIETAIEMAKEKKLKYFILGGGTSGAADDSLLKFKQRFSQITKPFYISGLIYIPEMYEKLIEIWNEQTKVENNIFLKYRLGV